MTTPGSTTLEAVNEIILAAKLYQVTALDTGNDSDAGDAERSLDLACRKIQQKGWHENTESNFQLSPPDIQMSLTGGVTGAFVAGETVTESTSSATGIFHQKDTDLFLTQTSDTDFTGGETLTGSTSSATVTGNTPTAITEGEIVIPADILRIDSFGVSLAIDICIRNGKLFDRTDRTYIFTAAITVECTLLRDFETLTTELRDYIIAQAAVKFAWSKTSNEGQDARLRETLREAQFEAHKMDSANRDINVLSTYHAARHRGLSSVQTPMR